MVVHESQNVIIEWIENDKIIRKTFHQAVSGSELKDAYDTGLEHLYRQGGTKWLSDIRALPPFDRAEADWILNDWLPRAVASGWKYWAVIERQGYLGGHSMRHAISFFKKKGLELRVFNSPEVGLEWLKSI